MVLEACVIWFSFSKLFSLLLKISIDNSESMRNGDFSPSRFEAQQDAVNLIARSKMNSNRENSVGLLSTAGKSYFLI